MFEREVYNKSSKNELLQTQILDKNNIERDIKLRTVMNWAEHCSECTMPSCFESCSFYTPRPDLKCARFKDGIYAVKGENSFSFEFGKWGKLEAKGNKVLISKGLTKLIENIDRFISSLISMLPFSFQLRKKLGNKIYSFKNKLPDFLGKSNNSVTNSDELRMKLIYHGHEPTSLKLTVRNDVLGSSQYQLLAEIKPGQNIVVANTLDIAREVNLNKDYLCSLEPVSTINGMVTIQFLDFVKTLRKPTKVRSLPKIKVIVWDLDNTLWKGTLIEDGEDNLILNNEIVNFIKSMDNRGILQSIASKNDPDRALDVLERFGLKEYFLYPQISWSPKSLSVKKIQKHLNVGMDTIAFIDDQPFEREEVISTLPSVREYDALNLQDFIDNPEFDVPITAESAQRRKMYQQQVLREIFFAESDYSDYESFIADCEINILVESLNNKTLTRAYELAQRTNQMNFSGRRYSLNNLSNIMLSSNYHALVVSCSDKFGEYGIIGLCIINKENMLVEDLMFSCRIQSKMVDYSFLQHLYFKLGNSLRVRFQPSDRNQVSANVFSNLNLTILEKTDGTIFYGTSQDKIPASKNLMTIQDKVL